MRETNRLIRSLSSRYLVLLGLVAVLVLLDQAVIQPLLVRAGRYAPAINLAGRQRMLSQKLSKAALASQFAAADEASQAAWRAELMETLDEWSASHEMLRHGDGPLGPARAGDSEVSSLVALLESDYQAMIAAGRQIATGSALAGGAQTRGNARPAAHATRELLAHERAYLPTMDRIVKLLELQSDRQIASLRVLAMTIALGVVALLAAVGWFVVRPATRLVRRHMDELEDRIADRTAELMRVNQALRSEISAREVAETRSRTLSEQLAHAARVSTMGHLGAGIAHEINQPLSAISNYSATCQLLLERPRPARRKLLAHFRQIQQAAMRAGRIVQSMRNFLRSGSGERRAVALAPLVREVAELCMLEARRSGVRITLDLPHVDSAPSAPSLHATERRAQRDDAAAGMKNRVMADPIQIQQVLVNLIQNAIQAMQGCPPKDRRVTIRMRPVDNCLRIEVCDQGPGFTSEQQDSLFQPFFTTKPSGLGVGLPICRSIIEAHGGRIWAVSTQGRGATVGFALPQLDADETDEPATADCFCR